MIRDERLEEDATALARSVEQWAVTHEGRLAAVTVTRPPGVDASRFVALFERKLAELGIDFVDVYTVLRDGPACLLSAEFDR